MQQKLGDDSWHCVWQQLIPETRLAQPGSHYALESCHLCLCFWEALLRTGCACTGQGGGAAGKARSWPQACREFHRALNHLFPPSHLPRLFSLALLPWNTSRIHYYQSERIMDHKNQPIKKKKKVKKNHINIVQPRLSVKIRAICALQHCLQWVKCNNKLKGWHLLRCPSN